MRSVFFLSATFALISIAGTAQPQNVECASSGQCIVLTRAQLLCVAKRIDRLLARNTDPVYFDAAQCGDRTPATMSSVPADIKAPPPANSPVANWIKLSKPQLRCLRSLLPALQLKTGDPIAIDVGSLSCQ